MTISIQIYGEVSAQLYDLSHKATLVLERHGVDPEEGILGFGPKAYATLGKNARETRDTLCVVYGLDKNVWKGDKLKKLKENLETILNMDVRIS